MELPTLHPSVLLLMGEPLSGIMSSTLLTSPHTSVPRTASSLPFHLPSSHMTPSHTQLSESSSKKPTYIIKQT